MSEAYPSIASTALPVAYLSLWKPGLLSRPSMRGIVEEVAEKHGLQVADLTGRSRADRVVLPRHEAMYRIYCTGLFTLSQIGRHLGDRDHTTVLAGLRAHARRNGLPTPITLKGGPGARAAPTPASELTVQSVAVPPVMAAK